MSLLGRSEGESLINSPLLINLAPALLEGLRHLLHPLSFRGVFVHPQLLRVVPHLLRDLHATKLRSAHGSEVGD